MNYLEGDFGLPPALFAPYLFFETTRTIYIMRHLKGIEVISNLRIQSIGLPAIRRLGRTLKPTTEFVQKFGCFAQKRRITLDCAAFSRLLKEGEILLKDENGQGIEAHGFHIVEVKGFTWGMALLKQDRRLISYMPKSFKF